MASADDVAELRDALRGLSSAADRDLQRLWGPIADADTAAQRQALGAMWSDLVGTYGEMAAVIGADLFEEWVPTKSAEMVRPVDPDRANARMRWALTTAKPLGNLTTLLDELVKQPARSTIIRSAETNRVRWARVPQGRTCAFCLVGASRGLVYRSQDTADRSFHGNCVVPGTMVLGAAVAATSRVYKGEVVTLSAAGQEVTVTPNHPVLTRRGWVAAQFVDQSDHLVVAESVDRVVRGVPDVDDGPAGIEERFRALLVEGNSTRYGMPGAAEQFHGDGGSAEVNVVARNLTLRDELNPRRYEMLAQNDLPVGSGVGARYRGALPSLRHPEPRRGSVSHSARGGMGGHRLSRPLGPCHPGRSGESGGAMATRLYSGLYKPTPNRTPGYPERLGEGVLTFPGEIPADQTIRALQGVVVTAPVDAISRHIYSGHVYNLQTLSGWFLANSIVTHNCDCTVIAGSSPADYPDGYDPDALYDKYAAARAVAPDGSVRSVTAALREIEGIH